MGKILKFGGKGLREGAHTWYIRKTDGAQINAHPGDTVDEDEIENARHYIDSGLATYEGGGKKAKKDATSDVTS